MDFDSIERDGVVFTKAAGAGPVVGGSPATARRGLPAGVVARPVTSGAIAAIADAGLSLFEGWFGPGRPMAPIAPTDVRGRLFDYPNAWNTQNQPRQESTLSGVTFEMLRRLADPAQGGLDLLRLAIETRKDQLSAQRWSIAGEDPDDDGGPAARDMERRLRRPDARRQMLAWQRMILEDHFVIDAVALYFGRGAAEIMDPALLKLLIAEDGTAPLPPLPAYQQRLKGTPAVDYTSAEVGYYIYNERSHRLYGFSRVEQVLGIVNLALNRQLSQLAYYTEGNMPEALLGVPDSWNPDQIKQAQDWFDALLQGNVSAKRKGIFVPGGVNPTFLKEAILKDQFDEWLARIVCFAFSLPPTALVKETNRATAQSTAQQAAQEGLEPTKLWLKAVMDDVLERFGAPGLRWKWQDEEITDPVAKANVVSALAGKKPIMTLDEARSLYGLDALTPEQREELTPAPPPPMLVPGAGPVSPADPKALPPGPGTPPAPAADEPAPEVAKAAGRSLQVGANAKVDRRTEAGVRRAVARGIARIRRAAVLGARKAPTIGKAADEGAQAVVDAIFATLPPEAWQQAVEQAMPFLDRYARERALAALEALRGAGAIAPADVEAMLEQANVDAVAWAVEHSAELVTQLEATTLAGIRAEVVEAIEGGLSNDALAERLAASFELSDARAMLIARTETSFAENRGTLAGFALSGVVDQVEWSVSQSEVCDECEALDGVRVPLGESFPTGDEGPPLHPNCRCTVLAVISEAALAGD